MTNDQLIDMKTILLGSGGALDALCAIDPDIASVISQYGAPPDRSLPANFDTLATSNYLVKNATNLNEEVNIFYKKWSKT